MIQIKNNLTGAVALFKTIPLAFKALCKMLHLIGVKKVDEKDFKLKMRTGGRVKIGFGNISIVISRANVKKLTKNKKH